MCFKDIVFKKLKSALTSFNFYYSMSRDDNTFVCMSYLKNVIHDIGECIKMK